MDFFLPLLAIPFAAAALCAFGGKKRWPGWLATAAMALTLAHLLRHWNEAADGALLASWNWAPGLGLSCSFLADGLSLTFAFLVAGLGLLIAFYAHFYLSGSDHRGWFFALLTAFAGSMMGLVLSDNLILFFLFWEATSVTSFFLIGFWNKQAEARAGALQALIVTAGGGLCMLASFVMMALAGGSWNISALMARGGALQESAWYLPMLVLFALGAFTKSAQAPVHFWLPDAMAAPTPVSAYLHSATMVKAGIFALLRFYPLLGGTREWLWLVAPVGMFTALLAAYYVFQSYDLKRMLAYGTVSQLGVFTAAIGLAPVSPPAWILLQIVHHAFYKGCLFLLVGYIDHVMGTRDLRYLGGMWTRMRAAAVLVFVAVFSAVGAPPFLGFWSKEAFYASVLGFAPGSPEGWLFVGASVLMSALTFGYALRIFLSAFLRKPEPLPPGARHGDPEHKGPRPGWLLLSPALLAAFCAFSGVFKHGASVFTRLGVMGFPETSPGMAFAGFPIWHGLDELFWISAASFAGGAMFFSLRARMREWHDAWMPGLRGGTVFQSAVDASLRGAAAMTDFYQNGRLAPYLAVTFGLLAAAAAGLLAGGSWRWPAALGEPGADALVEALMWLLVGAGAVLAVFSRARWTIVISLSLTGMSICAVFILYKQPDLALTQFVVEALSLLLVLAVFRVFPIMDAAPRPLRPFRLTAALAAGLVAAASLWAMFLSPEPPKEASRFYLEASVPRAGSRNVVNAIVVDFRGFDTMGEITVLSTAALCVLALTGPLGLVPLRKGPRLLILTQVSALLLPLSLLYAFFLLLRGHNWPGGGFIAGVLAAGAVCLYGLAHGLSHLRAALPRHAPALAASGLLLGAATVFGPALFGKPFLTHGQAHVSIPMLADFHVGSALLFDTGVFLVVVGAAATVVTALHHWTGEEGRP